MEILAEFKKTVYDEIQSIEKQMKKTNNDTHNILFNDKIKTLSTTSNHIEYLNNYVNEKKLKTVLGKITTPININLINLVYNKIYDYENSNKQHIKKKELKAYIPMTAEEKKESKRLRNKQHYINLKTKKI